MKQQSSEQKRKSVSKIWSDMEAAKSSKSFEQILKGETERREGELLRKQYAEKIGQTPLHLYDC